MLNKSIKKVKLILVLYHIFLYLQCIFPAKSFQCVLLTKASVL